MALARYAGYPLEGLEMTSINTVSVPSASYGGGTSVSQPAGESATAVLVSSAPAPGTVSISAQAYALSSTAAVADTLVPLVTSFSPADGSSGALTTANVVLKFNEGIQRGSGLITLKDGSGRVVETFDAASSDRITITGDTLSINPTNDLAYNTQYTVGFAKGTVQDLAGNQFAGAGSYDFRTRMDTDGPTVSRFSPADGSTGALTTANVVLKFNEAVQRGSGAITLKNAAGQVVEVFDAASSDRVTVTGDTLSINPTRDLDYNTQYFVSFGAGTVKDTLGNAFKGTSTYDFRTRVDTDGPTVTRFTPADGSTGALTTANVVLKFNEAIQRGAGQIVLKNAAGQVIETFDAARSDRITISNDTLTLNPTKDLDYNTQYFVSFGSGTVKDALGNAFKGTSSYDFRTRRDTDGPTVTRFTPADGSTGALTTANVMLKFNEPIQRGSGLITLRTAAGQVVETFDASRSDRITVTNDTLVINPTQDLAYSTQYFVSFGAGTVKDVLGNAFKGVSSYDFKTRADTDAPKTVRFIPADGATGVLPSGNVSVKFNETVVRGTGLITLKTASGQLVETFDAASSRVSVSGDTLTVNPTRDLAYNTSYVLSFAAGSVKDVAGNAFAGTSSYDFRTKIDTVAPTVARFTPPDGATGVALGANVVVRFNEEIRLGTGTISLKTAAGQLIERFDVANSARVSVNADTLSINPTRDLGYNTQYVVSFDAGTVKDLAGNVFAGTGSYDFKTRLDTDAPTVTSFSPVDGAVGAEVATNLVLRFNEAVQRGTGVITIKTAAGQLIESFNAATSNRISISNDTFTINPTQDLAHDTQYIVSFAAGTVKDLAGNSFAGTSSYDFKTKPAPVTPVVSQFHIEVDYSGDPAYQTYFNQAAAIWQNVIVGDLPDINGIDDIRLTASVVSIDGAGGTLAQAGPTQLRGSTYLPFMGNMQFDSADVANMAQSGTLLRVILHEMGHALGLGSLWSLKGLNATPGQYTGAQGVAAYRTLSGNAAATFVPLETQGGSGTANVHWAESVFDRELMTGYAESNSNMPLSRLTIAGLADLGYTVNFQAAEAYALGPALQGLFFDDQA